MKKNTALFLAGIIFGLVSLAHLLRIIFMATITIDSYILPMWVSIVGFIIAFILSALMFVSRKNNL